MGLPLIATSWKGCKDVAIEGQNALVCRAKDVDSLVSAMKIC